MKVHNSSHTVAIVVPLSNCQELSADEKVSLNHLLHFLGRYDKYLIAPRHLDVHFPGFEIKRFPDKFFGSSTAHSNLQLSRSFYESFKEYRYILMYHLDALVFSDQLLKWCDTDWDFIGSPWINCEDSPRVKVPRVGNSGFGLMKIDSFLKVLHSRRLAVHPDDYWKKFYGGKQKYIQYLNRPKKYLKRFWIFNNVSRELAHWSNMANSDLFWSDRAVNYYPEFKVAPFDAGLRFSFEVAPRLCFKLNNYQLPFGCHAWPKYDRGFWEPYLIR